MSNDGTVTKMYLGNLQEKTRLSGDKFLAGSLCIDDMENVPEEHIQKGTNGKRYMRIIINPYRDGANEYGNTHSIAVDTYKPNQQPKQPNQPNQGNSQQEGVGK
jgi:hypothetical protein